MEDICFPRGGIKPNKSKNEERPKSKNLFTVNEGKRRKKHIEPKVTNTRPQSIQLNSVDLLAYNKIQPSMLILGCVKEVLAVTVKVQLPGTLYADVQVNAISDKLTNRLVKDMEFYQSFNLKDIFQVGDFVPIQVLENGVTDKGNKRIVATTNPININFQTNCNCFRKGMLVWGIILEKSDHVYSVDLGVQNVRCILNIKDIDEGKEYVEGQPLWLLIKKVQTANNITTIAVTNLKSIIDSAVSPVCNLDILCPGSCVEVTCTKVLKNGLKVEFFNDCTGYINKVYLNTSQRNLNEYLNTSFKAYVLYKNSITKFVYFTMRTPQNPVIPQYKIGTVTKSTVIDSFSKGILIEFQNMEMGFVTFKRLIKSLKIKDNADFKSIVKENYANGTRRQCRIMDYSYVEQMYICTFETNIIKEKYFLKTDLKVGEIITGKIKSINKSGIVVKAGMVECFAVNEQLTNVLYSENIKLQYKVGKIIKARVLSTDSNAVKLTLKPALLEEHECLTSFNQAKVNHSYLGVVIHIKRHLAMVKFYNEVKGVILDKEKICDFTKLFYHGQVVTVTVILKKNERLVLSLGQNDRKESPEQMRGNIFDGVVSNMTPEGLKVTADDLQGFLPVQHLCVDSKLSKLMLDYIKTGHELFSLMCLSADLSNNYLFSIRENSKKSFIKSKSLTPGTVVRSSVNTFDGDVLKLNVFTTKGVMEVIVDKDEITDDENVLNNLNFITGQPLLVNIIAGIKKNKYSGTVKFSKVFNNDLNSSASYLEKYLNDLNIIQKLAQGSKTIADYKIGQKVNVRVTKITDVVCSVELVDGTIGIVIKEHMLKSMKVGTLYTAKVLFVNMVDNVLELSFKPQVVNQKYEEDPNLKKDQEVFAKVLLVRENLAVCSIKHKGMKSFGFIPIKLNENNLKPDYSYYANKNKKFRFAIYRKTDFGVIGFPSDLLKTMQKSRKRKLSENNNKTSKKIKLDKKKKDVKAESKERLVDQPNIENEILVSVENDLEGNSNVDLGNNDVNMEVEANDNQEVQEKMEEDAGVEKEDDEKDIVEKTINVEKPPLPSAAKFKSPGMKSFFNTTDELKNEGSDSESESDTNLDDKPKKRKLTKKEQVELLKNEEEELRKIELSYADMDKDAIPQTADQFDRRLLAEPNSSALWIQYAALHISNTEIDKARTVFRRALQSINHTLTEDLLNVWTAFINLEHMYGTKQSFNDVFNEAIKCNDDLSIYLHAIDALSSSQNVHDVDELIEKMVKKFRQELKMYIGVAKVYYKQKRFAEARKLRSKALGTVTEKKKHIPLIIQFAKLEFDNGEDEYAETLFETILKDVPQRIDVWIVYVDQLVKNNKIDIARRVLQRAVGQKLKIAKMTSLCKKYVAFEKQYGDDETRRAAEGILNDIYSSVKGRN